MQTEWLRQPTMSAAARFAMHLPTDSRLALPVSFSHTERGSDSPIHGTGDPLRIMWHKGVILGGSAAQRQSSVSPPNHSAGRCAAAHCALRWQWVSHRRVMNYCTRTRHLQLANTMKLGLLHFGRTAAESFPAEQHGRPSALGRGHAE